MISVAVFNNKGGVGKTTLLCNLAAYLAIENQLKVLVVDCDPQCNTTQLINGEDFAAEYYWNGGTANQEITTIRDLMQPISEGDASISEEFRPLAAAENRFSVDVLIGHPDLSFLEDKLSQAWTEVSAGQLGGYRKTNWARSFCTKHAGSYDVVMFDVGPSLGSLNRSVLLGCDRFITPMGTDIFSILGVRNISAWLKASIDTYEHSLQRCEELAPGGLARYGIPRLPSISAGFSGYTVNQYISKVRAGVRVATKRYEEIITKIPEEIVESLGPFKAEEVSDDYLKLGEVPHLYSLIPLAQTRAAPIHRLGSKDGIVGSQYSMVSSYKKLMAKISKTFLHNLGIEA